MSAVRITVELSDDERRELHTFVRRLRFDQAYELTESWKGKGQRVDQACTMIAAITAVWDALNSL